MRNCLMKNFSFVFVFLLTCNTSSADLSDTFSGYGEKLRPYFKKFLGDRRTNKLLGVKTSGIKMPKIPEVRKDARNVNLLKKGKRNSGNKKLSRRKKQKYDLAFIREVTRVTRQMKSTLNEDKRWLNVMSQGGTREGVYRGIVLEDRYLRLERKSFPINPKVLDFSLHFANYFLSQDIKRSALRSSNFYTLKKVLVERSLEVLDSFPHENDDLYDWYALLSSYLAKKYPRIWVNKLRKDSNAKIHKHWAKNVPEQHIKSEVIIKMHKVFNFQLSR